MDEIEKSRKNVETNNNNQDGKSFHQKFLANNNYEDIYSSSSCISTPAVELQVSNLDQTINHREMKKIITSVFREHVNVLHVSVFFQSDGNMAACVKVPSQQDAQFAISQLHRRKVGFKRILISQSHANAQNPMLLRSKVVALLSEVPGGRLQLFKFREMFERRFHDSVGVSDLYKMKDVVSISEDLTGRMVQLNPQWALPTITSSSVDTIPSTSELHQLDSAYCLLHNPEPKESNKGWAERENGMPVPNVNMSLSVLGPNVRNLIKNHSGAVPLASLIPCYEAETGTKMVVDSDEGVPLEHLVSAIKGIAIQTGMASGVKRLVYSGTANPELDLLGNNSDETGSVSSLYLGSMRSNLSQYSGSTNSLNTLGQVGPAGGGAAAAPLAGQLALFSRELVDLLKTCSGCRMPFNKFIPSYHHHFGRQCRVADYGYTKLKDLFEALPHVVQMLGEGSRAQITLSHRAQVKRFTSDLLRVLKAHPAKQICLYDLPAIFEKSMNRPFKISDYGVCEIEDILDEVSETAVVLSGGVGPDSADDLMISIPKREQTADEVERTHKFAEECVELLRQAADCRIPFNKFIPAYHHHFGRQCRVADYGFTKLIELFEAIPTTVEITEDADGERMLQLTDSERLVVIGEEIATLIRNLRRGQQSIKVADLPDLYKREFGYALRPDNFGEHTVTGILKKLSQILRIEQDSEGEATVRLIDRSYIRALSMQVKEILAEAPEGNMALEKFKTTFTDRYHSALNIEQMKTDLADLIVIKEDISCDSDISTIALTPLQLCSVKIQNLLKDYQDKLLVSEFEAAFAEKYATPLCPGQYGFPGLANLIAALPDNFVIRGRGPRKMIWYLSEGRNLSAITATKPCFPAPSGRGLAPSSSATPTRYSTPRHEGFRMMPHPQHHSSNSQNWRAGPEINGMERRSVAAGRGRPIPKAGNNMLGYGGGGALGGGAAQYGDFWTELAQFGIYPTTTAAAAAAAAVKGTAASGGGSNNYWYNHQQARPLSVSPNNNIGLLGGSPITSMLPTPHSPSPLFNNPMSTQFAFPPGNFWQTEDAAKK